MSSKFNKRYFELRGLQVLRRPAALQIHQPPTAPRHLSIAWTTIGCWVMSLLMLLCQPAVISMAAEELQSSTPDTADTAEAAGPLTSIEVYPSRVDLRSSRDCMRILVTGHYADGSTRDLSRQGAVHCADGRIASISVDAAQLSLVRPISNGESELKIEVDDQHATIPLRVQLSEERSRVSFLHDVLPALTKHDCNSGGCHGTPSGKGGFRLSLAAYDPPSDEVSLVRDAFGRRTNVNVPEESLLLRKPTLQLAHGGGRRLHHQDPAYATLRDWIAEGCDVEAATAPHCVSLQILPSQNMVLGWPATAQQLLALAHYSDGSSRDVTELAKMTSSSPTTAKVDANGLVTGSSRGDAAIMVRYLDKVETCQFTFIRPVPGFVWEPVAEHNFIDTAVYRKLKLMQYQPAQQCSDGEFLRRAHLDIIGLLPTAERTRAFLADQDPQRRSRLIDELLERPEYADYWAQKWADLLRVQKRSLGEEGLWKFHRWLVAAFKENMPLDRLASGLLTARGSTLVHPAANYYRAHASAETATEATAQLFLGIRIECAKCHNHPYERWTQDNYYGLSTFFHRIHSQPGGRAGESIVLSKGHGEMLHPRTRKTVPPWLPDRSVDASELPVDRTQMLAEWLTQENNPYFSKVMVNRLWAAVMGRGIVEPVDDFRDSNPASNNDLLEALANELRHCGYDQKHILRLILNSRVYQHSSLVDALNREDETLCSHAQVRPLSAEQLLDAIRHVTGVGDSFTRLPPGSHASQLPSPDYSNEFLKMYGQPQRETSCTCERSQEANLTQALQLFNGGFLHDKLANPASRFRQQLADHVTDEAILAELYLSAYCRFPDDEEQATVRQYLAAQKDRVQGWEDICWTILNSKEFLFQH